MKVVFWGTRGSLASPGPETVRYGGNTVCVEVRGAGDHVLVLDARLGDPPPRRVAASGHDKRVDVLLSHLHMDHIVGLGFFDALYRAGSRGAHLGTGVDDARPRRPASPATCRRRCSRCACATSTAGSRCTTFRSARSMLGDFVVRSALVSHPGPTVGYRIEHEHGVVTYLTDHEPALGVAAFPGLGRMDVGFRSRASAPTC